MFQFLIKNKVHHMVYIDFSHCKEEAKAPHNPSVYPQLLLNGNWKHPPPIVVITYISAEEVVMHNLWVLK